MKKKAIKIASASVMAASSFAAIAPFTTEAAVNLDATVNNAVSVALQAHQFYTTPAKSGQLVDWHVVQKQVIVAKSTYNSAVATVNKYAGSKKAYYLGKLASASKYIGYAQGYITATDNAQKAHLEANHLGASKTVADAKTAFTNFAADMDTYKANVTKLTADTLTKNLLVKVYFSYPETLKTIIPAVISANDSLMAAEAALAKGDTTTAKTNLDAYTAQLPNFNASGANVVNVVKAYQKTVQGKYDDATAAPAVTGVSAINGKQVLVTFNKQVDPTTAQALGSSPNLTYTLTGTTKTVTSAVVQEDGKSVLLTLSGAVSHTTSETFGVTVKGVSLASDTTKTFPIFSGTVTVSDTVAPVVAAVTSVTKGATASSTTVTFSEPVTSGYIKVDGVDYGPVVAGSTQTLTGLSLDATKSHTIEVVNLTDAAGNVTDDATSTFNVTKDAVAPVIASVSPQGDSQILVTFSKKMGSVPAANFSLKDESYGDVAVTGVAPLSGDTTGTKYVVSFNTTGLYANTTTRNLLLVVKGVNGTNTIADSLGNGLADTIKSVSLTKDVVAPTITSLSYNTDPATGKVTGIVAHFSEGVQGVTTSTTLPASAITVVDPNGVLTSTLNLKDATITAGDKEAVFALTTAQYLQGKYSFSFAGAFAEDLSVTPNKNVGYNGLVDFGATPAGTFTIAGASASNDKTNVIMVDFGTAVKGGVNAGSATDLSNYSINGRALPVGTKITLNDGTGGDGTGGKAAQTVAFITLPTGSFSTTDTAAVLRVTGVTSLTGATVNPYTKVLQVTDNVAPVLKTGTLNADGSVSLGFDTSVVAASGNTYKDLTLKVNGVSFATSGTGFSAAAFTVANGSSADTGKYVLSVNTSSQIVATNTVVNGVTYQADAATPADNVKLTFIDANGDGVVNNGDIVLSSVDTATAVAATATVGAAYDLNKASSVVVGIVGTPTTIADANGNLVTASTTITVK